ncbi:AraC family transcriptional regulator [Methylomonas sp. AM2-LC]|uniref:helix-turn-helix domain-containing protein n=1 Tax=Methylomonas sp. AM2-LC TaxID=3153301 RepID=UPI0032640CF8
MTQPSRLYERATDNGEFNALWDIRDGRTLFTGPLYYNASHQHGAPVFLAGLYGKFRLRLYGGDWLWCRTAIIPAGVPHELDVGGEPITVLYIEPTVATVDVFKPLINDSQALNGALVGNGGEIHFMRDLYEDRNKPDWTSEALHNLLEYAKRRSQVQAVDPRLTQIIDYLFEHGDDLTSVEILASQVELSSSRFQHMFSQQIGVPFRRYRGWNRMRQAIREIIRGHNFTTAAHATGFTDSAHFSHEFRKIFGAPPTITLRKLARLQV